MVSLTVIGSSTKVDQHLLQVEYEGTLESHTVHTLIIFGWVENATVERVGTSPDVFEFTGPILVTAGGVGGRNGKRGRRAIACSADDANLVTVTVEPV